MTSDELRATRSDAGEPATTPRHPLAIVAVDVRSLANVGILFRVADAVRAELLYLCGITGHPRQSWPLDRRPPPVADRADREIRKTALAAFEHVAWRYEADPSVAVAALRRDGYRIVALELTTDSVRYDRASYDFPLALVVGHEREGVPDALLASADQVVHVPMFGAGSSLNVATATAVCLYEILLHHGASGGPIGSA